jgi:hypothetical protein
MSVQAGSVETWVHNWDSAVGRNVALTKGVNVTFSTYLKLEPGGLFDESEVWQWDHFRLAAFPQLTYPECDNFHYKSYSDLHHNDTYHMLQTFLHAATHVRDA